ncbi:unnamed protein product [Linum tenue]|uniref:Uncharacterized protein n=1 Tax=Linum tenue TaxID=586396 RepID=A0AAV0JII1_9ROSI|nr:unnamed protein product [Linum tenue]
MQMGRGRGAIWEEVKEGEWGEGVDITAVEGDGREINLLLLLTILKARTFFLETKLTIELEEEYLMGEFDLKPDIDEKPPMPLRDMLEKVKPFLMSYEGIQSQEEWEEAVEETMKNVPLLKKIVEHYSGPDRVTAKQQQQELERVAETIPAAAPPSAKRFADRAVLSLSEQSRVEIRQEVPVYGQASNGSIEELSMIIIY